MINWTVVTLIIYLVSMFLVAWYFSRKESLEAYFINKGKTGFWMLTFASVATMIGAGATVAIVSETYNSGISYGLAIPISLIFGALILGLVSKRIKILGDKYEAYTLVDFFHKRFDVKNKILVFVLQTFLLVIWTSVQAIAIASLASVLIGVNYNTALFLAAGITILYTAIGGMKIDFITDFIQFWIIVIVFLLMAVLSYHQVGGIGNMLSNLPAGHLDPFAFGGVVWFVGAILLSGFLYLGNSSHWQRIVSAENSKVARKSFFMTIPFFFVLGLIIIFFGLAASVLITGINQDTALFELMNIILPGPLLGVGLAAILAVIMSSVDSLIVGGSTIVYRAIFTKKQFDKKSQVLYARLITALFGIVGFGIAFMVPNLVMMSLITTYLSVIFSIPVLYGLYSKKLSSNASFYSIGGSVLLLIIFVPILGPNSFVPPLLFSILTLTFYDKIFRRNTPTPLEIIGFEE